MCGPPNRHCFFQASHPLLGEPYRSLPQIALQDGDLDQPVTLQRMQVSGEGRLIEPQPLGQRAQGVVGSCGDLRHQPELSDRQA
jgi:hypothetical protein